MTFGEFLHFFGLWLLMSMIIGPQQHEFWASIGCSLQIQEEQGHGLLSLPAYKNLLDRCMVTSVSRYPPKNAPVAHMRYGHIAIALQEYIYVVIALQITLEIAIIIFKGPH